MKKTSITIIAAALNISKTTISFVLNGKTKQHGISDITSKNILEKIKELDYRPNLSAQNLRIGKTKTIGLIVDCIDHPFYSVLAGHIERFASKKGFLVFLGSTNGITSKARDLIEKWSADYVDGLIIMSSIDIEDLLLKLRNKCFPFVLPEKPWNSDRSNIFSIFYQNTTLGTEHLIAQGYTDIILVILEADESFFLNQLMAYTATMSRHDLKVEVIKLPIKHIDAETSQHISNALINRANQVVLLTISAELGAIVLKAIKDLNLRCPEEIALLVHGDDTLFKLTSPTISAIVTPAEEMARSAVDSLVSEIETGLPGDHYCTKGVIIQRGSLRSAASA